MSLIYVRAEFYVDGTSLPLVDFDVGPSWAGLLPISNSPNETRQVGYSLCMNHARPLLNSER